jgi:hypothetical protein
MCSHPLKIAHGGSDLIGLGKSRRQTVQRPGSIRCLFRIDGSAFESDVREDAQFLFRPSTNSLKDFPDHVLGPVDATELDKGGTIRWIQRKPNCKD